MDNENDIINSTIEFVKLSLKNSEGGHDWFHIKRVWQIALRIAESENKEILDNSKKADILIVQLAALLHDISDRKFNGGDELAGGRVCEGFLSRLNINKDIIDKVVYIIDNMSYSKGNELLSLEGKIVQDADRLDALGAIGIARTFSYGGYKNRKIYDPDIEPKMNMTKDEYKKCESPSFNHFYEKILKLKDIMNTKTGKLLAEKRHRYVEEFLNQFLNEWNSID